MTCKMKADVLPLTYAAGEIFIEVLCNSLLATEEIAKLKEQLDAAQKSAMELKGIIKQYFGMES